MEKKFGRRLCHKTWWSCITDIAQNWHLLIPAIAAMGMYALVYVAPRYIGAFVLLLWAGIFSGVRVPDSQESRKLLTCVSIAIMITIGAVVGLPIALHLQYQSAHVQWQVADGLKQMGIEAGDEVAFIGKTFEAYWARLAHVRVIAEIPTEDVNTFWAAEPPLRSRVLETFATTRAKVIVAERVPRSASKIEWQRIGDTGYGVYFLPR